MSQSRSIQISTDVFAQIWASRLPGEETEDDILRRILIAEKPAVTPFKISSGFHDGRHGIPFEEGFEIFRFYKGVEYRAIAKAGRWTREDTLEQFSSLNQLSRSIGAVTENAWLNWTYLAEDGFRKPIDILRTGTAQRPIKDKVMKKDGTWRDDTVSGLKAVNGKGPLLTIYDAVVRLRKEAGKSIPHSYEAIIRRTLEENCSETESYKGLFDLFRMPEGKGAGVWALK